ncbi:MAG: C40 family peptidase [Gemmatimonadota bacterium]|nr:C40 family peptidase [Gemmatimonadota bacterium]
MSSTLSRAVLACILLLAAPPVWAQGPSFEAAYGWWFPSGDSAAVAFHAGIHQRLWGPVGYGLSFVHLADRRSLADRTLSGGELSLRVGNTRSGAYALASTGLGLRHRGGGTDAFWTIGGGLAGRLFSLVTLGIEARYRVEDQGVAGFWRLDATDRKGLQAQARISFGIGAGGSRGPGAVPSTAGPRRGAGGSAPPSARPSDGTPPNAPLPDETYALAIATGASEEAARVTTSVVETALGAMGSPYRWGGTDGNGFDCSGLIQYAYAQHGIVLPRTSRDQARLGSALERDVGKLRPGDVLTFSAEGTASRVTHVGLYVGEGQFIHSSSTGVKTSSLLGDDDGDSRWWRQRWVGARRIVE